MTGPRACRCRHSGSGKFPYRRKADSVGWCVRGAACVGVLRIADLKAAGGLRFPPTARHRHCRNSGPSQQFVTAHLRFVNGLTARPRSIVRVVGDRFCCRRGSGSRPDCRGRVRRGPCGGIADFMAGHGRISALPRQMNPDSPESYRHFLPLAIFPTRAAMQVRAFHPNRNPLSRRQAPGIARPILLSNAQPTGGGHRAQA